jgi:hypothetical protein
VPPGIEFIQIYRRLTITGSAIERRNSSDEMT